MTTRDELVALCGGEIVGGNVLARVNGEPKWLGKDNEGVFTLTDEGVEYLADHGSTAVIVNAEPEPIPEPALVAAPEAPVNDDPLANLPPL